MLAAAGAVVVGELSLVVCVVRVVAGINLLSLEVELDAESSESEAEVDVEAAVPDVRVRVVEGEEVVEVMSSALEVLTSVPKTTVVVPIRPSSERVEVPPPPIQVSPVSQQPFGTQLNEVVLVLYFYEFGGGGNEARAASGIKGM